MGYRQGPIVKGLEEQFGAAVDEMAEPEILERLGPNHVLTRIAKREGTRSKLVREVLLGSLARDLQAATSPPRQEQLFDAEPDESAEEDWSGYER